ncbi:MAG: beta-N-acetylhexosaminidase [Anaerolineae bacterium]|nr:beta-N-acetylhexosaminidase [Anaerolineae bacterium]
MIPYPASVHEAEGAFVLTADTQIRVEPPTAPLLALGHDLAAHLRPATGFELPVVTGAPAAGQLRLTTVGADPALGAEGYQLMIQPDAVTLTAPQPAGLHWGLQTLRQRLPAASAWPTVQPGPWLLPCGSVRDLPRFAWRGFMLDVARHFFDVPTIKRIIDLLALHKLNRLHLHLTDDQGWRLHIARWPALTAIGGATAVGGGPGGYYTQADYADIVAYAQRQGIMVIPEIDMPGHTNAALAAVAALNADGAAPPLYTGTDVGFSSLNCDDEWTYRWLADVIGEVASLTPGPYIHIGGDETAATPPAAYRRFIERVQTLVQACGKQMIGWEEIAHARLLPSTVVQHWHSDDARAAVQQGSQVILSPASRTYLDMQYTPAAPLGLHWAGYVEVKDTYEWDPATYLAGVAEDNILGIEAPLWSETLTTLADIEWMAFPRLAALAEIAWSPANRCRWDDFRIRLAAHGARLQALGVNFYRSPQVPW